MCTMATTHAIRDVSLDIPDRQVTAFMGPSGCGKSTFLRALNRLHDLTRGARVTGQVLLDGQDVYAPGTDLVSLRQRVGMVFQRPNPFPKSIFENVAYGLRIKGGLHRHELAERVEQSLRGAALWDEVKDRLEQERARPLGRPAAAPLHRPRAGRAARGDPDG